MASLFDPSRNFSFYMIPAAWALALAPHAWAATQSKAFDNSKPREYIKLLDTDQTITQAKKDQIRRAEAASLNGFENLAFFAAAVVAGNVAGLSTQTLNALTSGYMLSRVLYVVVYVQASTELLAGVRSLAWMGSVGFVMSLYIMAGNVFRSKGLEL